MPNPIRRQRRERERRHHSSGRVFVEKQHISCRIYSQFCRLRRTLSLLIRATTRTPEIPAISAKPSPPFEGCAFAVVPLLGFSRYAVKPFVTGCTLRVSRSSLASCAPKPPTDKTKLRSIACILTRKGGSDSRYIPRYKDTLPSKDVWPVLGGLRKFILSRIYCFFLTSGASRPRPENFSKPRRSWACKLAHL